ncbi:hypothetical protein GCM10009411_11660 [Shewanella litoralis]|uniref:Uncharacterized protein n=1 Tax=Shewanella litoralis TaxID=2282700 RepID=A0ABQ2R460_9GAMM|nr:hypothetical protein GCM10009411_11660 [Shewanella litoralis]
MSPNHSTVLRRAFPVSGKNFIALRIINIVIAGFFMFTVMINCRDKNHTSVLIFDHNHINAFKITAILAV